MKRIMYHEISIAVVCAYIRCTSVIGVVQVSGLRLSPGVNVLTTSFRSRAFAGEMAQRAGTWRYRGVGHVHIWCQVKKVGAW
jgi:hypothetical protein